MQQIIPANTPRKCERPLAWLRIKDTTMAHKDAHVGKINILLLLYRV